MLRIPLAVLTLALLPAAVTAQTPGFADLVFTNDFNNTGGFNQTCRNSGTGLFACAFTTTNTDRRRGRGLVAADFDGDGDDDLVVANLGTATLSAANRVCLTAGGVFTCSDVSADLDFSQAVAAADLDEDSDVDVAFANASSTFGPALNTVCFNDGNAAFTCAAVSADLDRSGAVVAADLDGDGDRDLVFGNSGTGIAGAVNRACLNSGAGVFTCAPVSATAAATAGLAAADLDGDGDLDLVEANFAGPDRICLNSGAAAFTCADVDSDAGDTFAVAVADLDGDGDRDLAFANAITNNTARTNRVCRNGGAATFTCASLGPDTDNSHAVLAADFDADGDSDLVFANEDFFTAGANDRGQNRLCRNSGTGAFTCEDLSPANDDSYGVAIGNFGGMPVAGESSSTSAGAVEMTATPNPARSATTITLSLDAPRTVSIAVFDVLGREVVHLHDGALAAGAQTMRLDTSRFSAGVYVVRMTSGDSVTARRLTVVR